MSGQTKLPGKWMDFLRDSKNKKELFAFITSKVAEFTFQPGKAVYITSGESVVSVGSGNPGMLECNHEEADTRIVVHIVHALQQGMKRIEVRTVDTDVITILSANSLPSLLSSGLLQAVRNIMCPTRHLLLWFFPAAS